MPTIKEIEAFAQSWAPLELAESWDNPGTLVSFDGKVTGVLCTLDITSAVVKEAANKNCNVIFSHHPVIFNPLKKLDGESAAALLVRYGITAICMHTNLDAAEGGTNDTLARIVGLKDTSAFIPCGRIGTFDVPLTVKQLVDRCAIMLGTHGTYYDSGKEITKLAIVTGGGGEFCKDAMDAGADCLLTGEMHYHDALDAQSNNFSFIEAGHYETEFPIARIIAKRLKEAFPDIKTEVSETNRTPFSHF